MARFPDQQSQVSEIEFFNIPGITAPRASDTLPVIEVSRLPSTPVDFDPMLCPAKTPDCTLSECTRAYCSELGNRLGIDVNG